MKKAMILLCLLLIPLATADIGFSEQDYGVHFDASIEGISNFLDLTDTPSTYSGQAGLVATVNPGETGLIFSNVSASGSGITNISEAGDVDYTGAEDNDVLRWNDAIKKWVKTIIKQVFGFFYVKSFLPPPPII